MVTFPDSPGLTVRWCNGDGSRLSPAASQVVPLPSRLGWAWLRGVRGGCLGSHRLYFFWLARWAWLERRKMWNIWKYEKKSFTSPNHTQGLKAMIKLHKFMNKVIGLIKDDFPSKQQLVEYLQLKIMYVFYVCVYTIRIEHIMQECLQWCPTPTHPPKKKKVLKKNLSILLLRDLVHPEKVIKITPFLARRWIVVGVGGLRRLCRGIGRKCAGTGVGAVRGHSSPGFAEACRTPACAERVWKWFQGSSDQQGQGYK